MPRLMARNRPVGSAGDPLRRRRRFLAGIAAGAILVSGVGLAASSLIKSPRQLAAETEAPSASVITATVQKKVLTNSVVTRGTVISGQSYEVDASTQFAKAVVTRMPVKVGERVVPGDVLTEIGGRPVILLRGNLPAYRDLHYGATGPDVTQLQQSLAELGYVDGDLSGTFGMGTSDALVALYSAVGYAAPEEQEPGSGAGTGALTAGSGQTHGATSLATASPPTASPPTTSPPTTSPPTTSSPTTSSPTTSPPTTSPASVSTSRVRARRRQRARHRVRLVVREALARRP